MEEIFAILLVVKAVVLSALFGVFLMLVSKSEKGPRFKA